MVEGLSGVRKSVVRVGFRDLLSVPLSGGSVPALEALLDDRFGLSCGCVKLVCSALLLGGGYAGLRARVV